MVLKVEVLSVDEDRVRFLLGGVDVAFANALRRTMLMDVPCMVIDDIFFFDNSSVVADENLAHRIGLVPGDFVSEDPAVVPVSPGIPLTKIAPGQAVRLEAYARLGTGKEHAKWQPVSMAVYQHVAEIEVDEDRCTDCADCVKACPRDVFAIEEGKLRVVDVNACTICGECEKACPVEPSAVRAGPLDDLFLFTVESTGCLEPARLVAEAVRVLSVKLDEFAGKVERGETVDALDVYRVDEVERRRLYRGGIGAVGGDDEEAVASDVSGDEKGDVGSEVSDDDEEDVGSDVEQ
jgi:DNA-directed RNA polymerase subunit D